MPEAPRSTLLALSLAALTLAGCLAAPAPAPLAIEAPKSGVFSATAVFPGAYDLAGPYARPLVRGAFAILEPVVEMLPSEVDGAAIQVGIVRPDVPEGTRVPVIVDASPYYDAMTPQGIADNPKNEDITFWSFDHYDYYVNSFVPHGYAVAFVATRGTADSGGCSTWFGPEEVADVDQAVTWLGTQDWSNGNVGMVGISYEGTTPWMVASKGNEHLKTIVPVVGLTDPYSARYGNGSLSAGLGSTNFYTYGFDVNNPTTGRSPEHTLQGVVCPEAWEGLAATRHSTLVPERDPFGFWAERDARPGALANYRGSVLVAHGFGDFGVPMAQPYPLVNELEAKGVVVKHLLGQWDHRYPDVTIFEGQDGTHLRWDWAEILLHWFDRWLKGDASADLGPGAQVQDSSFAWRNEATWPPRDARPMDFHLTGDGGLSRDAGAGVGSVRLDDAQEDQLAYVVDANAPAAVPPLPPVELVPCAACPRFASEPFAQEFRFAGLPTLHLGLTPSGPGGHIAAFLSVEGAEGLVRVGRAQLDLRVADGGETARLVAPGEPLVARMQFLPLDVVIPAGGRLVLELTQGHIEGRRASLPTFPMDVAVGGDASVLTVHAFERGPQAFFEPPGVAG